MSDESARAANGGPRIDGRRRDDLEDELREMVPNYLDGWDPDSDDVGTTLLSLFVELAEGVTERLDRVPEKHRVSFFETLGFSRLPPEPARLPLSIAVADQAGENVAVTPGVQAKAEGTDGSERLFEVPAGGGFDATPANLQSVYSIVPDDDAIYDHDDIVGGDASSILFDPTDGDNLQKHALYIGDVDRLAVGSGSTLRVELQTEAHWELLDGALVWEYFGERTVGAEPVEGWHPFPSQVDFAEMVDGVDASAIAAVLAENGYAVDDLWAHAPDLLEREFPAVASDLDRFDPSETEPRGPPDADDGVVALEFEPTGTVEPTTVNDVESKWIRCRIPADVSRVTRDELFAVTLDSSGSSAAYTPPVQAGARAGSLEPDLLLRNDVPLEAPPIRPFGTSPREGSVFYIASTDAFTKSGASVTITFPSAPLRPGDRVVDREDPEPETAVVIADVEETADEWVVYQDETVADRNWPYDYADDEPVVLVSFADLLDEGWEDWEDGDPADLFDEVVERSIKFHAFPKSRLERPSGHDPELSWEYFDGEGWTNLPTADDAFRDGTSQLQHHGDVELTVPRDLAETTVAGHEGHWMRVRLVGGGYGEVTTEEIPDTDPPQFRQVERFAPPIFDPIRIAYEQIVAPDHVVAENNRDFGPDIVAEGLEHARPFERVPTEEQALYLGFDAPLTDGPINLLFDVEDRAYPVGFTPRLRWEYYDVDDGGWRRLHVRDGTEGLTERGIVGLAFPEATEFSRLLGQDRHWVRARTTGEPFASAADGDVVGATADRAEQECGPFLETVPPAGEPRRYPPTVEGLYENAVWVRNRETIAGEVLGSSDGSIDQTVTVANPPVVGLDLWVDELAVLSEGRRETLREQWPHRTQLERDGAGEPVAFWVRWERQPDLLDSGADERHYLLDPIEGVVRFGDGTRGKIPPRGSDNIRATYETGGGTAGNVPAGTVSGFQQSLAFVESVTNPIPGGGGSDAEATEAVTDRAAQQLRDRNRAVAPDDMARIARDASREVSRARCLPGMDDEGEFQPGWVTVLVVPDSTAARPTVSTTLQETVETAIGERAPATLVGADQLVVRGPSYVSVSVDADVVATGGSISALEERAREAVQSFLHPLTGGRAGDGWQFGELPCRSDFFELLEGIDRVDHIERLTLTFETSRSTVTIAEGDTTPDTSADALTCAGDQEIAGRIAGTGGGR